MGQHIKSLWRQQQQRCTAHSQLRQRRLCWRRRRTHVIRGAAASRGRRLVPAPWRLTTDGCSLCGCGTSPPCQPVVVLSTQSRLRQMRQLRSPSLESGSSQGGGGWGGAGPGWGCCCSSSRGSLRPRLTTLRVAWPTQTAGPQQPLTAAAAATLSRHETAMRGLHQAAMPRDPPVSPISRCGDVYSLDVSTASADPRIVIDGDEWLDLLALFNHLFFLHGLLPLQGALWHSQFLRLRSRPNDDITVAPP